MRSRNLLLKDIRAAVAVWLVLVQPVVAVAQPTDYYSGGTHFNTGKNVIEEVLTFDPRVGGKVQNYYSWGYDSLGGCISTGSLQPDPSVPLWVYQGQFWGQPDQFDLYSVGVNPANLTPEAIDLNIFPEFPISEELVLKPALAYSEDAIWSRRGDLNWGSPKKWQNHHGELVRLLSDTVMEDKPLGQNDGFGRHAVAHEIQTYIINAEGQNLSFYPDPAQFDGDVPTVDSLGKPWIDTWYAEQENIRLRNANPDHDDNPTYVAEFDNGLTYHFEYYQTLNGQDLQKIKKEWLSVHYRVFKITDRHGNFIYIDYDGNSLRPANAYSFKNDATVNSEGKPTNLSQDIHRITYSYDSQKRLTAITVPRVVSGTNTYRFYYPDQENDRGDALYETAAVRWKDGSPATVTTNQNTVSFNSIDIGTAYKVEADAIGIDMQAVAQTLSIPTRFPIAGEQDIQGVDTFYLQITNTVSSQTAMFRIGKSDRISPQQRPIINRPQGGGGDVLGFWRDLRADYLLFKATQQDVDPNPTQNIVQLDNLIVEQVDGSNDFLANAAKTDALSVQLYPVIKPGDLIIGEHNGNLTSAEIDLALNPGLELPASSQVFDPESVTMDGTLSTNTNLRHLRRENRMRIAEIAFPSAGTNGTRKRMRLYYDDQTVNHQEVARVEIYDDTITDGQGNLISLQQTEYDYERLWVMPATSDDYTAALPFGTTTGDLGRCDLSSIRYLHDPEGPAPTCSTLLKVGMMKGRHEEIDIMRQKSTSWLEWDTNGNLVPNEPQITHYGGSWKFNLAGSSVAGLDNVENPPSGIVPIEDEEPDGCGDDTDCHLIVWGLDGKPFSFTWQILPDGSAQVFDLTTTGLGLEEMTALSNERSRVFKTYTFDTNFKANFLERNNGQFAKYLDYINHPYFMYQPEYVIGQSGPTMAGSPTLTTGYPTLSLSDFFDWNEEQGAPSEGPSLCYAAQINTFELVPLHGYTQTTDPTNGADYFRRTLLRSLHGLTNTLTCDYWRTPGVKYIHDISSNATEVQYNAEMFLQGRLIADLQYTQSDSTLRQDEVEWALGGRTDMGDYLASFNNRPKTHMLKPHFSYQLTNLEGFGWNPSGHLLFGPEHFQSGTRYSNGGFLAEITGQNFPKGTEVIATDTSELEVGDVMYHDSLIYTITQKTSSSITISPELRAPVDSVQGDTLLFYRASNPGHATYMGYDSLNNNSYQENYVGKYLKNGSFYNGLTWTSDTRRALVPGFDRTYASTIAWNDSHVAANNDTTNWKFFGRVTKSYSGNQLPVWYVDPITGQTGTNPMTGPLEGFVTRHEYGSLDFPWKPTRTTNYFTSVSFQTGLDPVTLPTSAGQDRIQEFTYSTNTSMPLSLGKPLLEKTGLSASLSNNDYATMRYVYDDLGYVEKEIQANYKSNSAPYANYAEVIREPNQGLPLKTIQWACNIDTNGNISNPVHQRIDYLEYDYLGREVRAMANHSIKPDPYAAFQSAYRIGGTKHTTYVSPMETRTKTTEDSDINDTQLSEQIAYVDGNGRETLAISRQGQLSNYEAVGKTYDEASRPVKEYAAQRVTSIVPKAVESFFLNSAGFTLNYYNSRGEVGGTETFLNGNRVQANWSWQQQLAGTGNMVSWTYFDEENPEGSDFRINLKRLHSDGFGNLITIRDFSQSRISHLSSLKDAENFVAGFSAGIPDSTELTRAVYSYDQFGNVIEAVVGMNSEQTRNFKFDQHNRLFFEKHPEMTANVVYSNFDHLNNPLNIAFSSTRSETRTHDAYGNILTATYNDTGSTITDTYIYTDLADGKWPGKAKRVSTTDGTNTVTYQYTYTHQTGDFDSKRMTSDFPGFTGSFADLTHNIDYDYEETSPSSQLGLPRFLDYPDGGTEAGASPALELEYALNVYGPLNVGITETSLNMDLVHNATYGVTQTLTGFEYPGYVDTAVHDFEVIQTQDNLNRLTQQQFKASRNGAVLTSTRDYSYDEAGRIASLELSNAANRQIFTYDALGQLATAKIYSDAAFNDPNFQVHDYTYSYDGSGLGNLSQVDLNISGAVQPAVIINPNLTNNQIGMSGYAYDAQTGELTDGSLPGSTETFVLNYNARGRIASYDGTNNDENYFYDAYGMRVFKNNTTSGDQRLYFYSGDKMALMEFASDGTTARWDTSRFFFNEKTAATYEWDEAAASGTHTTSQTRSVQTRNRSVAAPRLLSLDQSDHHLRWGRSNDEARFDLQIGQLVNDNIKVIKEAAQIPSRKWEHGLAPGNYYARVAASNSYWGKWEAFTVADTNLGLFRLDGNSTDSSSYANTATNINGVTVDGVVDDALEFPKSAGAHVLIDDAPSLPSGNEARTYMGWVDFSVLNSSRRTVFEHGNDVSSSKNRIRLSAFDTHWELHVGGEDLEIHQPPAANQWHHYAVTSAGNRVKFYVNGNLVADKGTSLITDAGDIYLGKANPYVSNHNYCQCEADELQIHAYAMDAMEIRQAANPHGLSAQYHLDGNADDSSLSHLDGTNNNGVTVTGVVGDALDFPHSSAAHVLVEDPGAVLPRGAASRSYMGWVNLSGLGSAARTVFEHGPDSGDDRLRLNAYSTGWELVFDGTALNVSATPATATWTHFAVTSNGTSLKLYIDGVLVGNQATTLSTLKGDLYLGKANPTVSNHNYCRCSMDEFEVYDHELSATDIQAAANSGP